MEQQSQNTSTQSIAAEIDSIMKNDTYLNGRRGDPAHDRLVDRMLELQGIAAEEEAEQNGGEKSDHIGMRDNLAPDATQPVPSALDAVLPQSMPVEARRAWVNAAAEVSMGGHELGALAKEALAFRNDTNNWSYEAGEHALREEHGVNAPMLLQQAKAYLKEFPGVKNWIEARGLGNNPHVIKVLAARQAGREAIQKQIDELRRDPEYTAKVPRDHARARAIEEQIMALQEALHG